MTNQKWLSIRQMLSPWSIGDEFFDSFDRIINREQSNYPPHNVVEQSDTERLVQVALAGMKKEDIKVTSKDNLLEISYEANAKEDDSHLFRGIANRSFSKTFMIPDNWEVRSATMSDGMLEVVIEHEVPESEKVKVIEVM